MSGLDTTTDGSLQDRVDALRLTTQPLLDSGADDLIRVTKVEGPQYVGGIRVNPGDSVVDYSALGSRIDGTGIGYEHVIGTDYNDTLISDWSNGHVISGGAGDDHLGSRGGGLHVNDYLRRWRRGRYVPPDGRPEYDAPTALPTSTRLTVDRIELQFETGGG